ncbi:MAG: response regulator [Alteromonadaceae bacterium]|nr:response regulator [Alteromonadaceae bacterium]
MNDSRICIVEPDEIEQDILSGILSEDFSVEMFSDGLAMLQTLTPDVPTLVILETMLPGPTGYDICQMIRDEYSHCVTSVVFLSAKTSVEERLKGLEAGADDYINKPYDILEISAKVNSAIDLLKSKIGLKEQLDYASQTAFQAMSAQSEMGIILKGVQGVIEAESFEELCDAVFSCMAQFDLKCTLYYEISGAPQFQASPGRTSSTIEQEIILKIRAKERIWTKGHRAIFTFGDTSLLILNMPEDQEKTGRLRDSLCFLMEAFDVKTDGLNKQQALVDAENWQQSIKNITLLLTKASHELQHSVDSSTSTIRQMMQDLDMLLPSLGLEEDQEARIHHITDSSTELFNQNLEKTERTSHVFSEVLHKLQEMQQ